MINPRSLKGEYWAEYNYITDFTSGRPEIHFTRTRVLKLKGINGGRYMFEIFPTKLWVLYSDAEVRQRYQRGMLLPLIIEGGKA